MYCKANFKSVAKCKKRLCTAVFALFKKNTRRVAWPVLQSRCKALSALSQNTLKNTKTGRKSVGFLILTQAPKCTRSHCFPPQKHPKNGFMMRFAGKNSFFQLRARDFSFYMNAYNKCAECAYIANKSFPLRVRLFAEVRPFFGSVRSLFWRDFIICSKILCERFDRQNNSAPQVCASEICRFNCSQ